MKLVFSGFMGVAPKFADKFLQDGYAAESINTRAGRGLLEPWKASTKEDSVFSAGIVKSIAKYNQKFFSFDTITSVTKVPLKNDPWGYAIICTEGNEPRVTYGDVAETGGGNYPTVTYELSVPSPLAPVVSQVLPADDWYENDPEADPPITGGKMPTPPPGEDEYDVSRVSYALAYRDAWGRLSALSGPSEPVEIKEFDFLLTNKVEILIPSAPSNLLLSARGNSATVLIYRTSAISGNSGIFQFVDEITVDQFGGSYTDTKYTGDLLDAPISEFWTGPPDTDTSLFPNGPMEKTVVVGADIIAGHNQRLICFAEPDVFYAYPVEYFKVVQEDIVTIESAGSNLVVLTKGYPYVYTGNHPASMSETRLADPVPCAGKQAVTEVADAVFFAATTGLHMITGTTITNVSKNFMTEREWRALDPATMVFANYDGRVFMTSVAQGFTYVFDPAVPLDALRKVDFAPIAFTQDEETNDLLYLDESGSTKDVMRFDSKDNHYRLLEWQSKEYEIFDPVNFCVMRVKATQYPVTVTVEAEKMDGLSWESHSQVVQNQQFVYLPFQGRSKRWRVGVTAATDTGVIEIREITLSQTPAEMD